MHKVKVLLSAVIALCLVALGVGGAVSASATTSGGKGHTPVNVCHATSSDTNPYVFLTVDDDSVKLQGHLMHRSNPNKQWKSDLVWRGQTVHDGDAKRDLIGDYTDKDGVLHTYDGVIDEASDCGTATQVVTEPDGSFTAKCTADGAAVTVGDLTSGTFESVSWTLKHGQQSATVHEGDVVSVSDGETVTLSWSAGDDDGVVQSDKAPNACPQTVTEPSGSFSQQCADGGVQVTLSGLDPGTYGDVTWSFSYGNHTVSGVTDGQKVLVQSGDQLTLTWHSGESSGTAKSGTAKECPPPPVCVGSIKASDVSAHYTSDAFHAVVTYTGATPLCDGVSYTVSLNSYQTQGPTWPTSGTQTFVDHDSVTLDKDHTLGSLSVEEPSCYYQTDLYKGSTRYDGVDGPVPHYDDVRIVGLIDFRNGGDGCQPPPVQPTGTFRVTCDNDGAVVTIGTLSNELGVTWRLRVDGTPQDVASGDVVQVPGGADLKLVWRYAGDSHVVKSATAPEACPPVVVTPTAGSFTWQCTATGARVDLGALSETSAARGTFALVVNGVSQLVSSRQTGIGVPSGATLVLRHLPPSGPAETLQSGTAPQTCPTVVPPTVVPPTVVPPTTPVRDLTITKSVAPTGPASFGDTLTYALTVSATGTAGQTAVTVTDAVPAGTSYVTGSAACPGGCTSVTVAQGTVTWVIGDMAAGSSRAVSFQVTIDTPAADADGGIPGVTIVNSGVVGSSELPSRTSNEVSTPVTAVQGVKHGQTPDVEGEQLPHTGADSVGRLSIAALLLVGLGGALVMASTGRRPVGRRSKPQGV